MICKSDSEKAEEKNSIWRDFCKTIKLTTIKKEKTPFLKILVISLIVMVIPLSILYYAYLNTNRYTSSSHINPGWEWSFDDLKYLQYDVWFEDPNFLLDNTYLLVRFNGRQIGGSQPYKKDPNLSIVTHVGGLRNGDYRSNHAITGRLDKMTTLEIEIYYYNNVTKESYLYETQTVVVTPQWIGYNFEVTETRRNENFDWSVVINKKE